MTHRDAPDFMLSLQALAEALKEDLTPLRIETYFQALEDLPLPAVQAAMTRAVKECQWFPKPVEIRRLAGADSAAAASRAWDTLLEHFQMCNGYDFPEPSDLSTKALIRIHWGTMDRAWEWWRVVHERSLERKREEFVERYQDYARTLPDDLPRLPGGGVFRRALGDGA